MSDSTPAAGPSRHLSIVIDRPWRRVYEYVSDPRNLPRWAAGLAGSEVRGRSPSGR
ncbi:SRPBCC family protein [Brachybacterium sp. GPGPB12]|uniref:SRPBCC family protein n=1 Tax=Brachybacterium sp. GPGPB12 TaxID=3023517 RepID=UPI0031345000